MKKFTSLIAVLLLPAAIIACSDSTKSSGSAFSMSTLPSKFSVSIPASITGTAPAGALGYMRSVKTVQRSGLAGTESTGCTMMKNMTGMMSSMTTSAAMFAVLADAAIAQNNLTADGITYEVTITFTQDMADAMTAIDSNAAVDTSAIGQSITANVTYSIPSDTYAFETKIEPIGEMAGSPVTISWSADKKKTKLSIEMTMEGGMDPSTLEYTYDDDTKLMAINMDMAGNKMELSLQEEGEGALFFYNGTSAGSSFRVDGYADDIGGYVKITTIGGGFSATSYTETFDAAGLIISDDGSYSGVYSANTDDIESLQSEIGFSTSTTLADGDYIIFSETGHDPAISIDGTYLVGYGKVTGGTLVIQNIGGAQYDSISTLSTVYAYKASSDFFGESAPTFGSEIDVTL